MLLYPEPMKTITYSVVGVLVLVVGAVIYDRAAVRYADVDEAYPSTCTRPKPDLLLHQA
jgi:hypothetical protein